MRELAACLRAERARCNMTLKEAAKASKVHYVSISRYESGVKVPTLDILCKLANAYGVTASTLLQVAEAGAEKAKNKKPK